MHAYISVTQTHFPLELEVAVVPDQERRAQLNSSAHLVRVFESEHFVLHSPDIISYTQCGQVPHVTADLCSSTVNGGLCKRIYSILDLICQVNLGFRS